MNKLFNTDGVERIDTHSSLTKEGEAKQDELLKLLEGVSTEDAKLLLNRTLKIIDSYSAVTLLTKES